MDQCIIFTGVLKDNKRKDLIEKAKSSFQWFPIGLDAKKFPIRAKARADLKELNNKYEKKIAKSNDDDLKTLNQKRKQEELNILNVAKADFDTHRERYRIDMLNMLKVLLNSTNTSSPTPVQLSASQRNGSDNHLA
jgi:hypothetical protein